MSLDIPVLDDNKTAYIQDLVDRQRVYYASGQSKDVKFRIAQLKKLKKIIAENEELLLDALYKDLHKSKTDGYLTEIGLVLQEIDDAIENIPAWVKPQRVKTPLLHAMGTSKIHADPYGNILIIAPWNYPFQLLMSPLVGAMAAGNTSVIKPSEYAVHTSNAVATMIKTNFDENYIAVVEGAVLETKALLEEKFDYIFFTGSTQVGRIVYQAAAKHLTPVTLELGGKSPCIVDSNTHLEYTAKRIVWGKFLNAGQTCIAPDYLLVQQSIKDKLVAEIEKQIKNFYGEDASEAEDFCRIINERHFDRLVGLIESGGDIVYGGEIDREDKYISPTIVDNVEPSDPIMQEEIFGPVLPVLTYDKLEEAISFVNKRAKPLALYVFSKSDRNVNKVLDQTSSGGATINDTLVHIVNPYLPFGGVGESGMGAYHGQKSFDTFSHKKSVLHRSFLVDMAIRYAPYGSNGKVLRSLLKYFNK